MKFSTVLAVLAIVSGASAATPDVVHLTGDIAASDDAAETTVQYKTLLRSTPNVPEATPELSDSTNWPEATPELSSDSSNTQRGLLKCKAGPNDSDGTDGRLQRLANVVTGLPYHLWSTTNMRFTIPNEEKMNIFLNYCLINTNGLVPACQAGYLTCCSSSGSVNGRRVPQCPSGATSTIEEEGVVEM